MLGLYGFKPLFLSNMCGIVGKISLSGEPAHRIEVAHILPVLSHRGPDDRNVVARGPAVFGHVRLSILGVDSPAAKQPLQIEGRLLTFNGEIYNFKELGERLGSQGIPWAGDSDTEVLAKCLWHWGTEESLSAIDGMFAFAWFDPTERSLLLARDPMGEKPLYWAQDGNDIWFASEIKGLQASGRFSTEPNLSNIDDFFYTAKINGTRTIFRDIREVEPGTTMLFRGGESVKIRRYWSLEKMFCGSARLPDKPIGKAVAEQIAKAVRSRRISDVPIGVLLSGGIDSNTIVEQLVSDKPQESFELFFADNANSSVSERDDVEVFLRYMSERFPEWSPKLSVGMVDLDTYMDLLRKITWHYDEPVQFYNSPLLANLCASAQKAGLKVLLSGEGSDEIFCGYDRFLRTAAELAQLRSHREKLEHLYFGGGRHSVDAVQALTGHVASGAEETEPWQWLAEHLDQPLDLLQLVFSQRYRLQTLLQRQDRIGMAYGIEIRVPFLRPALVSWANRLPTSAKVNFKTGETKICLREAMRKRLPSEILTKKKDGFPSDMIKWLRMPIMENISRELVEDVNGFCSNYLNHTAALNILTEHYSGRRRFDVLVWNMVSLELWHRVCGPASKQSGL